MCFGTHCVILRETSYRFTKPSAYCKVVTTVELENIKHIMRGFLFTKLLTVIKTILLRSCDLNTVC